MLSMANAANIVATMISLTGLVVLMLLETKIALLAGAFPNSANSLSLLTGDLFGMQNYNKLYPVISFAGTCGYALGVPFLDVLYDIFGIYVHIFWVCIALLNGLRITKMRKTE